MIEPRCKHNWTTPPECPQCCADERDQLKEKIERADEWRKMSEAEYSELEKERDQLRQQLEAAQKVSAGKDEILKAEQEHRLIVESVRDSLQNQLEAAQKALFNMQSLANSDCPRCKGWVSPEKVKALMLCGDNLKLLASQVDQISPFISEWDSAKKDL